MHQELSARYNTSRKTDPLEHSPNSWTPSKTEQFSVKTQISSSPFIPTINAITSSQELQWMVQPMSGSCLRPRPYDPPERSSLETLSHTRLGVIWSVGSTCRRTRQPNQLNPDEEEKGRQRRERNKLAAAKCRNRRRELTDQLQEQTEELEQEQASLQNQVEKLQEERQRLELMLVSHASVCHLLCTPGLTEHQAQHQTQPATPLPLAMLPSAALPRSRTPLKVKQEPVEEMLLFSLHHEHSARPPCNHNAGEYDPTVDCFRAPSGADCSPGRVMDLSTPMLGHPGLEGQDRDGASPQALTKDMLSKLQAASTAMTLEDGTLAPLVSPTLLTL